ncbi:MAG TPA: hypothetical protein VJ949_03965, partial [Cryomorphaceae bacterium]|nr:hypothetical protein [Cryomorphaceae bacterium]
MKGRLTGLAWLTLIGFPLLGWGILYFFRENPWQIIFRSSSPILYQLLIGLISGTFLGFGARWIITRPF